MRLSCSLLLAQVEWYLTRRDVAGDGFLMEQLTDPDGWVPISTLCAFPRMRKLCHPQLAAVAHVLSHSPRLQAPAPPLAISGRSRLSASLLPCAGVRR